MKQCCAKCHVVVEKDLSVWTMREQDTDLFLSPGRLMGVGCWLTSPRGSDSLPVCLSNRTLALSRAV